MITSPSNPRLKLVRRLLGSRRQRDRLGLFVCEGEDLVEAGIRAGAEPVERLVAGEDVEPALLAELSSLAHPPREIAVFRHADLPRADRDGPAAAGLALWRVADAGNVGTLVRTADALGPAVVGLSAGCADPTGPKALRASMGAIFRVPLVRFDETPGRQIALVPRGGPPLDAIVAPTATTFVLGAEREGLPPDVIAACDEVATIPSEPDAESLNVAVTGAIALYALRLRRRRARR